MTIQKKPVCLSLWNDKFAEFNLHQHFGLDQYLISPLAKHCKRLMQIVKTYITIVTNKEALAIKTKASLLSIYKNLLSTSSTREKTLTNIWIYSNYGLSLLWHYLPIIFTALSKRLKYSESSNFLVLLFTNSGEKCFSLSNIILSIKSEISPLL